MEPYYQEHPLYQKAVRRRRIRRYLTIFLVRPLQVGGLVWMGYEIWRMWP